MGSGTGQAQIKGLGAGASPHTSRLKAGDAGASFYFLRRFFALRFLLPILRLPLRGLFLCGCGIPDLPSMR
jgi:hypothetical protein